MKLSVCIGTYNRAGMLAGLLESVRNAAFPRDQMEVLVIDNNSTDSTRETAELARPWFDNFKYLFEKRQGLSYARNTGIEASAGEIICFLDDDTTIDPSYFREVSEVFSRFDCAGVGARIVPEWNCPKPEAFAIEGPYNVAGGLLVAFDEGDQERNCNARGLVRGCRFAAPRLRSMGCLRNIFRGSDAPKVWEKTRRCLCA